MLQAVKRIPIYVSGVVLLLAALAPASGHATIIKAADAIVLFDQAPFDGQVFYVPKSNPFLSLTVIGWAHSQVSWEIGTIDDYLLHDMYFGDQDALLYGWQLTIDGIGDLHTSHAIIGGGVNGVCYTDEYDDEVFWIECGTTIFDKPNISWTATVGVGTHFTQLQHSVYSLALEVLATDVLTHTFYVEALDVPAPGVMPLLGIGMVGLIAVRRRHLRKNAV